MTQIERRANTIAKSEPLAPQPAEIDVLSLTEKVGFQLTHRMNQGRWKRLMTFGQRHIGSLWIYLATYNLMQVFGIDDVQNAAVEHPVVLVANHRSFFDMF